MHKLLKEYFKRRMSRSRYTLLINQLINSFIDLKNFRVYLEHAHPAFLTTLVVLVIKLMSFSSTSRISSKSMRVFIPVLEFQVIFTIKS